MLLEFLKIWILLAPRSFETLTVIFHSASIGLGRKPWQGQDHNTLDIPALETPETKQISCMDPRCSNFLPTGLSGRKQKIDSSSAKLLAASIGPGFEKKIEVQPRQASNIFWPMKGCSFPRFRITV